MSESIAKPTATHVDESFIGRASLAWVAFVVVTTTAALARLATGHVGTISDYFLVEQDLGVTALATLVMLGMTAPGLRVSERRSNACIALAGKHGWAIALGLAAFVAVVAYAGWRYVAHQHPLSMDEFWATFDASVFQHGLLLAPVSPEWRAYVPALQPTFRLEIAGNEYLGSSYLPGNAALRAFFGLLGDQALTGPVCEAASIALTYDIGRRLWPARPDAALVGAALLATSSQLIVTAMTPYAMSAHLALNLLWLWLFLKGSRLADFAAALVALAAMGLHQFIFHPLFAAPFVLRLWLEQRWLRAGFYTIAYLVFGLVWAAYFTELLEAHGVVGSGTGFAGRGALQRALDLIGAFDPAGAVGFTAENLLRFAAWQNPLAIGLGLVGAILAVTKRSSLQLCLAAGIVLTTLAMVVLLPFQGHGWGYRYLHGLLGNLCLLAAFAWQQTVKPEGTDGRRAWAALGIATAFALLVALPMRAAAASSFIAPYARAQAAIEAAPADVVLVDPAGLWYAQDLVRNDPFLAKGPKVLDLDLLSVDQVRSLCARYRVAIFDRSAGAPLGIRSFSPRPPSATRRLLTSLSCGGAISVHAETAGTFRAG